MNPLDETRARALLDRLDAAWTSRDTARLAPLYAPRCRVRHGAEVCHGRNALRTLLQRPPCGNGYRQQLRYWAHGPDRVAATMISEWWDETNGFWFRGLGSVHLHLDDCGCIDVHDSVVDVHPVPESERQLADGRGG